MAQLKDLLVSGAARFLNGLNINGDLTIAGNLLPAENETYNLGDSSYRWRQTQTKYLSVGAGDISSGIYEAVISGDLHTTGYSLFDDYVQIGGTRPSNYKFYVNGISFFNGDTIHNGIDYFANGTTYYINNNAVGNLNWLKLNRVSDHGLQVGTIRGMAVDSQIGEYIHMYERVHIGSPSGWGSRNAPSYGLSTYGGAWFATDTGVVNIGNTSNTTYKFYVNGSSYFNGNTTHNGINYFANGTTYYINNSAQASLNNVSIGGIDFKHKLYVNGTSYLGGNITIKGYLAPDADSTYDIGLTSKHWRYGYFDGIFISTENGFTASSTNQGKSGSYLGSGNIEIASSTPYIDFHNANSTSDFSVRLISDAADRLHIQQGTTPASLSYNSRTINPLTYHQGIFYVSNQIESAEYFLNNRASAGGGFYVYGNNVQYARLYINTIGTTSDVGITQFELGNNRATSTANNSRGKLYIYGQTASTKLLLDATDRPFMYLYCADGNNYYTNTTGTTATDYWQIYPEGQHLCFKTHTTGSYNADNGTGAAGEWKYIQMFENGGLALNSTSQSVTPFGGSATTFILRAEGNGYFNGDVWSTASFIANASSSTAGQGFVARNQNVQYARMYIETIGTAGDGTNNGTVGLGLLMLGNSTAVSTSTTTGANNARGAIRLYGTNTNYTDIYSQTNGNRNFYLPNYAGSMYAIHAGSNSAVGNATTPVYIAENGRVTACTSYTSALDGRYVNITGDTMTGNLTVPIVIGSLQGNASTASKVNNKLTVGSKTFDGSTSVTIYASDLGLASAMLFLGTTSTSITDGVTTNPITISGVSKIVTAGNVVLYGSKEFVWTGSSWEELGNEGSYKIVQAAVADPSASGTSNTFIATISQDANGKITTTKKTVAVTNSAPTLSWGVTSTIGSVAGTNLQVKMPANPNTDTKVTQTVTDSNTTYPLLLAPNSQTTTTTTTSYFDSGVTLNPSTNTIAANISGNAATTTKLQTARTISLTGSVTGSGTFDGSNNLSITTTVASNGHNHTYISIGGSNPYDSSNDTIANWITKQNNSTWWYDSTGTLTDKPANFGFIWQLVYGSNINQLWFSQSSGKMMRRSGNSSGWATSWKQIWCQGDAVTGAVWNDYAECRQSDCEEFGYVLMEAGDDSLTKTTERLSHFAGVSSDTWGFSQGETKKAKTPIAVAGRVLVYPYRDRNNYKPGDCVCAAPGGTVDIMTREEIIKYPDRIVGTVSCIPKYEIWGGGELADRDPVEVNGRIWIKVH